MEKKILVVIALTVFLFFLAFALRNRKLFSNILLGLAAMLATLLVVEFAYRLCFKKKDLVSSWTPKNIFEPEASLGYTYSNPAVYTQLKTSPNGDTIYNATYTILDDTINSGIHFNFRKGYKTNNTQKEVVFLGCSLTFGQGLNDNQSLPFCYGAAADISTVNMAGIGYGIHQVYQLFDSKFSSLDNYNRIFIFPFFYDHILRANGIYEWNNAGPFFDLQHDSLVNKGPLYKFKQLKGDKLAFYLSCFGSFKVLKDNLHKIAYRAAVQNMSETDYQRCFLMLQQMAKKINESGGRLIIVNWADYNWFYKPVSDLSKSKIDQAFNSLKPYGVQVIPVSSIIDMKDPKNFIPIDGHPSAAANKAIANWLAEHITISN